MPPPATPRVLRNSSMYPELSLTHWGWRWQHNDTHRVPPWGLPHLRRGELAATTLQQSSMTSAGHHGHGLSFLHQSEPSVLAISAVRLRSELSAGEGYNPSVVALRPEQLHPLGEGIRIPTQAHSYSHISPRTHSLIHTHTVTHTHTLTDSRAHTFMHPYTLTHTHTHSPPCRHPI